MISKNGIEMVKRLEGFSPLEYTCVAGCRTIGYGHVLKLDEEYVGGVGENEAEKMLLRDLQTAENAVDALVAVPLTPCQKDALVSFVFNIGVRAFSKSTLLRLLNEGEYARVPEQMNRWVFVNGRPCFGLARRRKTEAAMFVKRKNGRAAGSSGKEKTHEQY